MEIFIIPLIALAVWVLQYIFRGPEENKPANRQRPGQARPPVRPPQRRPVTDLDRYLEETRRRKQQQEEKRPVVIAEVVPEPPRVEPERRRPVPPPPRPPVPRPAPRVERRPARVPPPVPEPVRRPLGQPETVRPVLLESAPVAVPVPEPSRAPASVPRAPGQSLRNEAPPEAIDTRSRSQRRADASALLTELTRMFRTQQGLAAALVLQEVLGKPLSQRPRR